MFGETALRVGTRQRETPDVGLLTVLKPYSEADQELEIRNKPANKVRVKWRRVAVAVVVGEMEVIVEGLREDHSIYRTLLGDGTKLGCHLMARVIWKDELKICYN